MINPVDSEEYTIDSEGNIVISNKATVYDLMEISNERINPDYLKDFFNKKDPLENIFNSKQKKKNDLDYFFNSENIEDNEDNEDNEDINILLLYENKFYKTNKEQLEKFIDTKKPYLNLRRSIGLFGFVPVSQIQKILNNDTEYKVFILSDTGRKYVEKGQEGKIYNIKKAKISQKNMKKTVSGGFAVASQKYTRKTVSKRKKTVSKRKRNTKKMCK